MIVDRSFLDKHIYDTYGIKADYPWSNYPTYSVYRHKENGKWFAVAMELSKDKVGLSGNDRINILNVKCDFMLIGNLLEQKGFFPAYHMNKSNWISVALDGSVESNMLKWLLNMSYDLTKKKIKKL